MSANGILLKGAQVEALQDVAMNLGSATLKLEQLVTIIKTEGHARALLTGFATVMGVLALSNLF